MKKPVNSLRELAVKFFFPREFKSATQMYRHFAARLSHDLLFIKFMGYSLKNARHEKACQEKTFDMAKFEAPGIKE